MGSEKDGGGNGILYKTTAECFSAVCILLKIGLKGVFQPYGRNGGEALGPSLSA